MKKIVLMAILVLLAGYSFCQEQPYIQLNIRENFLTQKIDFLDGPKVLTKPEIQ